MVEEHNLDLPCKAIAKIPKSKNVTEYFDPKTLILKLKKPSINNKNYISSLAQIPCPVAEKRNIIP